MVAIKIIPLFFLTLIVCFSRCDAQAQYYSDSRRIPVAKGKGYEAKVTIINQKPGNSGQLQRSSVRNGNFIKRKHHATMNDVVGKIVSGILNKKKMPQELSRDVKQKDSIGLEKIHNRTWEKYEEQRKAHELLEQLRQERALQKKFEDRRNQQKSQPQKPPQKISQRTFNAQPRQDQNNAKLGTKFRTLTKTKGIQYQPRPQQQAKYNVWLPRQKNQAQVPYKSQARPAQYPAQRSPTNYKPQLFPKQYSKQVKYQNGPQPQQKSQLSPKQYKASSQTQYKSVPYQQQQAIYREQPVQVQYNNRPLQQQQSQYYKARQQPQNNPGQFQYKVQIKDESRSLPLPKQFKQRQSVKFQGQGPNQIYKNYKPTQQQYQKRWPNDFVAQEI